MLLHKLVFHFFVVPPEDFFSKRELNVVRIKTAIILAISTPAIAVALGATKLLAIAAGHRS